MPDAADGELELTFDPWCDAPLEREPVTLGVPFPPGVLASPVEVCLFDGDAELYCQRQVLSSWPDGSVRWLLLDSQVDLPPAVKTLRLRRGDGPAQAALTETGISLTEERSRMTIDSGPLRILSHKYPFALFEAVHLDGAEVLAPAESQGFQLTDLSGKTYSTTACPNPTFVVETSGPLRTAVRIDGSHVDEAGHPLLDFSILITVWSDKPYAAVDYQFIHRGGDEIIELHGATYSAAFKPREPVRLLAEPREAPGSGLDVHLAGDAARIDIARAAARNVGATWPQSPWVSRSEGDRGIAVGVRHAVKQFPKRLAADARSLSVAYCTHGDHPMRLHQGSAKSHQTLFYFHGAEPDVQAIARRFRLFDLAPRPRLPAAWYHATRAFGGRFPSKPLLRVDLALDQALDARPAALGIRHFGDEPMPDAPPHAPDARRQSAWSNNAYDLAHALILHYARTGELRHFAAAEALVRHVLDIDYVHFSNDPLQDGGLAAPGVDHCENRRVRPDSQWIDGLLAYHYLTGCQRTLPAVRRIGENVLRHVPDLLDGPPALADVQAVGWTLHTVSALYRELGKPRYFDAARKLVARLEAVPARAGGAPCPSRTDTAVALTGIVGYHLISQEQRAADHLLRQLDALLAQGIDALWRRSDPASLRADPIANALLLEPLAFAHQLTRQARYLDAGRAFVRHLLAMPLLSLRSEPETPPGERLGLIHRPELVPASGVALARLVRPLLAYLAAAESAGQLGTLGLED